MKLRIIKLNNYYYPQKKSFLFWKNFKTIETNEESTDRYFSVLEGAIRFLKDYPFAKTKQTKKEVVWNARVENGNLLIKVDEI